MLSLKDQGEPNITKPLSEESEAFHSNLCRCQNGHSTYFKSANPTPHQRIYIYFYLTGQHSTISLPSFPSFQTSATTSLDFRRFSALCGTFPSLGADSELVDLSGPWCPSPSPRWSGDRPPKSSHVERRQIRQVGKRVKGVESHLGTATNWVTSLLTTFIPTQNKLKSSAVVIEHLILKNSMFDVVHALKLNKNLQKTYQYHTYMQVEAHVATDEKVAIVS